MTDESLSFTLRPAETHEDLLAACEVRAQAYGHHDPAFGSQLAAPDAIDSSPWTHVYLCEDKISGRVVGTMRAQATSLNGTQLQIDRYVELPAPYRGCARAEMTRLAAVRGADPFVRLALFKAAYLFCIEQGVGLLMIGARKPSLVRAYEQLGARDIHADGRLVQLGYAGDLPHRVLGLDVATVENDWRDSNHALLDFMTGTRHADIRVSVERRLRNVVEAVV